MSNSCLDDCFNDLLKCKSESNLFQCLGNYFPYMFFSQNDGSFELLSKKGYGGDYCYSFLNKKPEILSPVLTLGHMELSLEEAFKPKHTIFATIDNVEQPNYLLLAEMPQRVSNPGLFLRTVLTFILSRRSSFLHQGGTASIDAPVWLENILSELLGRVSPVLIIAEPGSGKEELVQSFLKKKYGGLEAGIFFHPGRLSQAVQLRELFGDPAGIRLGGASPTIPIVDRKEPVVIIQEAADLDNLAQLRLLALFSTVGRKKLWIFETNRDLKQMAIANHFLPGLHDLLWKNSVTLPSLRNCLDHLSGEVNRLMGIFKEKYRRDVNLSPEVYDIFSKYSWPGNWRELKNTLESAYLMVSENTIYKKDLRLGHWSTPEEWDVLNLRKHSETMEKMLLLRAYALHAGNQVQMAKALGISRGSLQYKLDKYRLN